MVRLSALCVAALLLLGASGALAGRCPTGSNCENCDTKGRCLTCSDGYGLTPKGKCIACKVPGPLGDFCTNCDGNAKYCKACSNWEGEGTGVYAKNGRCERCPDANCEVCHNGSGKCQTCFRGMAVNKATGKCTDCADKNCITCDSSLKKCSSCYSGYAPNSAGACVRCTTAHCDVCSSPTKCKYCSVGYVLVGGKCKACKVVGCDECKAGRTDVCKMCEGGVAPKNGKCPAE